MPGVLPNGIIETAQSHLWDIETFAFGLPHLVKMRLTRGFRIAPL